MKKKLFVMVAGVLVLSLLLVPSVGLAGDPSASENSVTEAEELPPLPPELECDKFGKCELDNVLDPTSPNYDPSQRYGGEDTRFGPPEKRSEDIPTTGDLGVRWTYHGYFGTDIFAGKSVEKVLACQKISTSLDLNDTQDYLYAPTMMAPDYCRLESVAYYHYTGSSTDRYWKVWEHTSNGQGESFIWATPMNASFYSRYVRSGYVNTMIIKTGASPTWTVYLYDWTDWEWDSLISRSGNSSHSYGWDIWEEYDLNNDWPDLPMLRSYSLRVFIGGNYYNVTSTYGLSAESLPGDFPYDYGWYNNYYDWYVGP